MLRRSFLKNIVSACALASLPVSVFWTKRKLGLSISDPHLAYLTNFQFFKDLDKILAESGANAEIIADFDGRFDKNTIFLAALNSSYGRFCNFDVRKLIQSKELADRWANEGIIKTSGPSGKSLSLKSKFKVLATKLNPYHWQTLSPLAVDDAYPHFFNSHRILSGQIPKSYLVDSSTRKSVQLRLRIPGGLQGALVDLKKVEVVAKQMQETFDKHERHALNFISARTTVYKFEELINYSTTLS